MSDMVWIPIPLAAVDALRQSIYWAETEKTVLSKHGEEKTEQWRKRATWLLLIQGQSAEKAASQAYMEIENGE